MVYITEQILNKFTYFHTEVTWHLVFPSVRIYATDMWYTGHTYNFIFKLCLPNCSSIAICTKTGTNRLGWNWRNRQICTECSNLCKPLSWTKGSMYIKYTSYNKVYMGLFHPIFTGKFLTEGLLVAIYALAQLHRGEVPPIWFRFRPTCTISTGWGLYIGSIYRRDQLGNRTIQWKGPLPTCFSS